MRIDYSSMVVVTFLSLGIASPAEEKNKPNDPPRVAPEKVMSSNGPWTKLTGKVKVVHGYILRFEDGTEVDLRFAIDVPEPEQQGLIGDQLYPCGREASDFLAKLVAEKTVTFFIDGDFAPGRKPSGPCYVGETHVQLEMVRNGWAVSRHSGMDSWEIIARENKRGLWRGQFIAPKEWRKGERLPGEK